MPKNNTSGYKGVQKRKTNLKKPFVARICYNQKSIHLGYFETAKEAALAYNYAARRYFGKFAKLNELS